MEPGERLRELSALGFKAGFLGALKAVVDGDIGSEEIELKSQEFLRDDSI
jgi:hypothetical protein